MNLFVFHHRFQNCLFFRTNESNGINQFYERYDNQNRKRYSRYHCFPSIFMRHRQGGVTGVSNQSGCEMLVVCDRRVARA